MSRPAPAAGRGDRWAIAFAIVFPTVVTAIYFTALAAAPQVVQHLAYGSLKIVQFGFPLFWFWRVQRGRLRGQRPPAGGMVVGLVFGAAVLGAMWVLYRHVLLPAGLMEPATEAIRAKVTGFGVATLPAYAALAIFYALVHSLLEEYYWRWFVFDQLRRHVPVMAAVAISSGGFMAHHVILLGTFFGWTSTLAWIFSLAIAVGGAVWARMYARWPSLYPVWLSHLLVDAGIFLIGYDLIWNVAER